VSPALARENSRNKVEDGVGRLEALKPVEIVDGFEVVGKLVWVEPTSTTPSATSFHLVHQAI